MARLDGAGTFLAGEMGWGDGLSAAQAQAACYLPAGRPDAPFAEAAYAEAPYAGASFVNPLYAGADPWVVQRDGWYYLCQAGPGGKLEVWKSKTFTHRGERRVVWAPPRSGWNRSQVWAPELHYLRGKWYIYYAAANAGNASHRMGVLEAATSDPQGPYIDRGMLYTGDHCEPGRKDVARPSAKNRWAIDGTVLELGGQLYFIWSGWEGCCDVQHLYIAPMSDPCTVSGNRVRLCDNDTHNWERVNKCRRQRGLNEGPQVLARNGKVFLIYSCSGSWETTYKLGMLYMDASADPLNPASWKKQDAPAFQSSADVFGVGHCCFVRSPDMREDWILYHAKRHRSDGWERVVRAQPFGWRDDGLPDFGSPAPTWAPMAAPSGQPQPDREAMVIAGDSIETMHPEAA